MAFRHPEQMVGSEWLLASPLHEELDRGEQAGEEAHLAVKKVGVGTPAIVCASVEDLLSRYHDCGVAVFGSLNITLKIACSSHQCQARLHRPIYLT